MKRLITIIFAIMLSILIFSGGAVGDIDDEFDVTWNESEGVFEINDQNKPQLMLMEGNTYKFNVDTEGEPFMISDDSSLSGNYDGMYTTEVENPTIVDNQEMSATDSGELVFTVPENPTNNFYYKSANTSGAGSQIQTQIGASSSLPSIIGTIDGIPYWLIIIFTISVSAFTWMINESRDDIEFIEW